MIKLRYLIAFAELIFASCSFDSTFFAVNKQNLNSKIINLNYEAIYVDSADDKKVLCHLYKPADGVKGTIFFLQGSGDNLASWSTYAAYLVNVGYEVIMIEYRGFGTDTGKATHENVLSDAETVLKNLSYINSNKERKLILLGQSYGGQIAINLTSKYPEKVAALVVEGTFTSFNEEVVYQVPFIFKPFLKIITSSPYKSIELISKINNVPTLVIHSEDDRTVPFSMGQELYSKANQPKLFWAINGEHIHGLQDYTKDYIEKIGLLVESNKSNKYQN